MGAWADVETGGGVAERGFLFIAVGERQCQAARLAIAALRARGHELPVALVTDGTGQGLGADTVLRVDGAPHGAGTLPAYLPRSPFAETVFIAHDLVAVGRVDGLFGLFPAMELALAQAVGGAEDDPAVPAAFRGFQPGVIAYRLTEAVRGWLAAWGEAVAELVEADPDVDAAAETGLRRALWRHRLALAVLPPEYNYRAGLPGFLRDAAVLVHSPERPAARVGEELNREAGPRVFAPFARAAPFSMAIGGYATAARGFVPGRTG